MTTIIYKDGTVAFDSLVTRGNARAGIDSNKARKFKFGTYEFIIGAAGIAVTCEKLFAWAETNFDPEKKPQEESLDNLDAFIIDNKNKLRLMNGNFVSFEIKSKTFAVGSGSDFALGAMEAGASAIEALKVAIKYDTNSGGPIRQLNFKE
jgi:ATP-dependent protease HslVU (ClpYQ) peptidase subunit